MRGIFRLLPSMLQGWTPLMSAVSASREKAVAALLAGGADTSAKNSSGQTALHYAVRPCCCLISVHNCSHDCPAERVGE